VKAPFEVSSKEGRKEGRKKKKRKKEIFHDIT
jgi:hypothetical protein